MRRTIKQLKVQLAEAIRMADGAESAQDAAQANQLYNATRIELNQRGYSPYFYRADNQIQCGVIPLKKEMGRVVTETLIECVSNWLSRNHKAQ